MMEMMDETIKSFGAAFMDAMSQFYMLSDDEREKEEVIAAHVERMSKFLDECIINNIDINEILDDKDNENALHFAVRLGDLPVVKLLIARGIDRNVINYRGYTPITMCDDLTRPHIKQYFKDGEKNAW